MRPVDRKSDQQTVSAAVPAGNRSGQGSGFYGDFGAQAADMQLGGLPFRLPIFAQIVAHRVLAFSPAEVFVTPTQFDWGIIGEFSIAALKINPSNLGRTTNPSEWCN